MGAVSSKNLQEVTVAEVQVHVAALGKAYKPYAELIADNGFDGNVLYEFENEEEFKKSLKEDLKIESPGQTIRLVNEWKRARETQAKRQKLMKEKHQTTVQLTNTDLFFAPPEVPKPQLNEDLTPFIGQSWLEQSLASLLQQKDRDDADERPLPLALVRCSRGGKTRAIKELMHMIPPEQAATVYVSFNNETSISVQTYFKDSVQELCDRIGFAARKGDLRKMNWRDFRDIYHVDPESIEEWLGKEGDCILFIDELNLLSSISVEVTQILKESFLIKKGRQFCFSSHFATTSLALRHFLPDPSNREMILRKLPLISSLSEARNKLVYPKLSARETLYFGLIPGLLVERAQNQTITNRRAYAVASFIAQLNLKGETEARKVVSDLFNSFITGFVSAVPEILQELMTAEQQVNKVVLRWIPCHMEFLLSEMWLRCDFLGDNKACLKRIYEHLGTYLGSKEQSGDAFEALFIVIAIFRCLSGTFESKILPLGEDLKDLVVKCDAPFTGSNYNETQDPMEFVKSIPPTLPEEDQDKDQVSIYYPGHARFNAYDVIIAFWKRGGAKKKLFGYQMKEGQSTGKPFAYDEAFDTSYLIRGKATSKETSIRLFTACNDEQVENFFGLSGSQWTPRAWKALQESG